MSTTLDHLQQAANAARQDLALAELALTAAFDHRTRCEARVSLIVEVLDDITEQPATTPAPAPPPIVTRDLPTKVNGTPQPPVPKATKSSKSSKPTKRTSDAQLVEIADVYLQAVREGRKAITALMDHFGVERSTAKNWPARCRDVGLLPPADQPQIPAPDQPSQFVPHRNSVGSSAA